MLRPVRNPLLRTRDSSHAASELPEGNALQYSTVLCTGLHCRGWLARVVPMFVERSVLPLDQLREVSS